MAGEAVAVEPFKIHILGCGSALPTMRHNPSAQVVEIREKQMMVDCGEGTQLQLRRARVRFTKISNVFISHKHGDHCLGLTGMISTFGLLGRTAPLHVYAPEECVGIFQQQLDFFCPNISFEVELHAVDTTRQTVVYEDRSLTVETIPLYHRVACCGYLFKEKPLMPHIRRDLIDMYGIPVSQINNIKRGMAWTSPEGETIAAERLTTPADPPRSYAYCSDTRYDPSTAKAVEGVTLLYHESTYGEEESLRAQQYYHSTAADAAMTARDAHAGQLLIGHYSTRYDDETLLLNEARRIFPNTILAAEGITVEVGGDNAHPTD